MNSAESYSVPHPDHDHSYELNQELYTELNGTESDVYGPETECSEDNL